MTTTQHRPDMPAQRLSSGKDVLSRMLQMERHGKQNRASSASPTFHSGSLSGPMDHALPNPSAASKIPVPAPLSPLRPSTVPRSQTMPSLADVKGMEMRKPALESLDTKRSHDRNASVASEICLSPSWSDHGEKRRKRDKKNQKKESQETEKKARQEEEMQRSADRKAGKRLSKRPPPAAMDTQKMPSALRRNSLISFLSSQPSSQENSRRSSREEKRFSGTSFISFKLDRRSQSTPATSAEIPLGTRESSEQWRSIVSPVAPKLPNLGFYDYETSSGPTSRPDSWGSDDAYERDLIKFAYRLEASADVSEPQVIKIHDVKDHHSPRKQQPTNSPAFSRSHTEPNLMSSALQSVPDRSLRRPQIAQRDSSIDDVRIAPGLHLEQSKQPDSRIEANKRPTKDSLGDAVDVVARQNYEDSRKPISPQQSPQLPIAIYDGNSYVHKQRMYQQQLSIAGYEDQLAVKFANEKAAEVQALKGQNQHRTTTDNDSLMSNMPASNFGPVDSHSIQKHVRKSAGPDYSVGHRVRDSPLLPSSPFIHPQASSACAAPHPITRSDSITNHQQCDQNHPSLRNVRDSATLSKPEMGPSSMTNKIKGWGRRSKNPPSYIAVPEPESLYIAERKSLSTDLPPSDEPATKRSRFDRMPFRGRKGSASSAATSVQPRTITKMEESAPTSGPSRTRTTSSQVLNENIPSPLPTPLPVARSSTTGNDTENRFGSEDDPDFQHDQQPAAKSKPETAPAKDARDRRITKTATKISPANKATTTTPRTLQPAAVFYHAVSSSKANHQLVVESVTDNGLIRKTSINRPRSNPQLQTQGSASNTLPKADFLPPLKHQAFIKCERSPPLSGPVDSASPRVPQFPPSLSSTAYISPLGLNPPDLSLIPRSPHRQPSQFPVPVDNHRRHNQPPSAATSRPSTAVTTISPRGRGALVEDFRRDPVGKMFTICCKCKRWHDLPSDLFEAMCQPKKLQSEGRTGAGTQATLDTAIKCPWCLHGMTDLCCQTHTTVVYFHEKKR